MAEDPLHKYEREAGDDLENARSASRRSDDLCAHIFSASATLIGVCVTVVGVIRVLGPLTQLSTIADDLLAVDSVLYLLTCLVAYHALRSPDRVHRARIERMADFLFLLALGLMVVTCAMIVYAFI